MKNRRIILKERATGLPGPKNFELVESEAPEPAVGQVLVRNRFVSVDPAMKGWISVAKNYASVETGATMRAFGVGEVVESRHPDFRQGDFASGFTGWQDYGIADDSQPFFRKVDPADGPRSTALGIFGISGLTAWFGLLDIGRPKAGETLVVSTAAGAVGSAVGQIGRLKGCRTVGIAGGPAKTALCTDVFGYDAAIDYKGEKDLAGALAAACPDGIDIYYDNVGGATLDTVMTMINLGARIIICGTAATESWSPPPQGMRLERAILVARAKVQGFIIFDYAERFPEALDDLRAWVKSGDLAWREEIVDGLENAPEALASLYRGANMGRLLVRTSG
ncbi:MAG TPA: NADP-dependent oxidoreductase [Afifellaceae bacterium]|nr:NADP-dependent oxidoreductase [Afifellaceae bacterium]